jgi:hypothetical protein
MKIGQGEVLSPCLDNTLAGVFAALKLYILDAGGCRKHNFWTARVKSIRNHIFVILTSRAIDWYIHGSNRGGGGGVVPRRVFRFLQGVSCLLMGHFHGILNVSSESLAQAQSTASLFEQIG